MVLTLLTLWYAVGLIPGLAYLTYAYLKGEPISLGEVFSCLFFAIFGPIAVLTVLVDLIFDILIDNWDKVIVKGSK